MHFLNVLPLALGASAFLVPAEVKENVEVTKHIPASAKSESIKIGCDGGCPVAVSSSKDKPLSLTKLPGGKFVADITVKDDKVLFNGQRIWPQGNPIAYSVKQAIDGDEQIYDGLLPISTSLDYKKAEIIVDEDNHLTVHPISLEVLALGGIVVHAESVEIRVAEVNGGVGLLPSRIRPYESSPYTDNCTTVWCRVKGAIAKKYSEWRQAASKKIGSWRGCGRKGVHKINGLPIKGGPAKYAPGSTLDPNRHRGPHGHPPHHPHHFSNGQSFFITLFETVIFPTIFGLSVGLIFGAFSWIIISGLRRLRAGPQAEYIVVEQIEVEEGRSDGPPKYEEVYREPQVESEDEKKELLQ